MLLDYEEEFSSQQGPIIASAASEGIIDLKSAKKIGAGEPVRPYFRTTEAFNNLTSLDVAIQGTATRDANGAPDFSSPLTLCTRNFLLAALAVNKALPMPELRPDVSVLALRAYYTVNGAAPTTGKLTGGLLPAGVSRPQNAGATY